MFPSQYYKKCKYWDDANDDDDHDDDDDDDDDDVDDFVFFVMIFCTVFVQDLSS